MNRAPLDVVKYIAPSRIEEGDSFYGYVLDRGTDVKEGFTGGIKGMIDPTRRLTRS